MPLLAPTLPPYPETVAPPGRTRPLWRTIGRVLGQAVAVLVIFLILGNLLIAGLWKWESSSGYLSPVSVDVTNFRVVDERVWRGAAPGEITYRDLAAEGATTVVDLRAEADLNVPVELIDELGLKLVQIPIRDGQVPSRGEVDRFLDAVATSSGPVYVHCGAGVGRTGAMVAAYLVATGRATGLGALRGNLAVGPPSLEQLAFAASLDGTDVDRPPLFVVAASRVLDAPRRIWSRLG